MLPRWLLLVVTLGAPAAAQDSELPAAPEWPVEKLEVAPASGDDVALRIAARLERSEAPWRHLRFVGTVVAPDGSPLDTAVVWLIPDGEALVEQGFHPRQRLPRGGLRSPQPDIFDEVPLYKLEHVEVDAEGAFELTAPWRESCLDDDPLHPGPRLPLLVIAALGYATRVDYALCSSDIEREIPDVVELGSIRMEPEARLSGRVVDEEGRPLSDVRIRVVDAVCQAQPTYRDEYDLRASVAGVHDARSDVDGHFEIRGLFPGWVMLELRRPDRGRVETARLTLRPQATNDAGDLLFRSGRAIRGQVVDPAGKPLAGAWVHAVAWRRTGFGFGCVGVAFEEGDDTWPMELTRRYDERTLSTETNASGSFEIVGSWDEPPTLYAEAPGFEPTRLDDVEPGSDGLHLQLRASASYVLRLTGLFGRARLEAYRIGRYAELQFPGLSSFALPIVADYPDHPGRWRIEGVGPLSTVLFVSAEGCMPARHVLPGLTGEQREITIELEPARELRGLVLDEAGRPFAGAHVDLTTPGHRSVGLVAAQVSGQDGRFVFTELDDGSWDVVVDGFDHIEAVAESVRSSAVAAAGASELVEPALVVRLERGGTIAGRVERPKSAGALSNISITLDGVDYGEVPFGKFGRFGSPFTRTDETGRFEFHGVRPGRHVVSQTFGKAEIAAEVEVAVGQSAQVVLVLPESDER